MSAKLLFIDVETTGLPKSWSAPITDVDNWPRAVAVGWKASALPNPHYFIVRPVDFEIPMESPKIHGITTDMAESQDIPIEEILHNLSVDIGNADIIVAHNVDFDFKILGAEYIRLDTPDPFSGKSYVCTMRSSVDVCMLPGPRGYKWPKLEELYHCLFSTKMEKTHDAVADLLACERCFYELKDRGVYRGFKLLGVQ